MLSTLDDRAPIRRDRAAVKTPGTHSRRKRQSEPEPIFGWCSVCAHRSYDSRRDARRIRRYHGARHGLAVFRCPFDDMRWHLGHRPEDLSHGVIDRTGLAESRRTAAARTAGQPGPVRTAAQLGRQP